MIPADLAHTLAVTVECGSLEAAADELGISQPAVSQRIKALESIAGTVLLIRSRPVRATAAGEAVVAHGRRLALMDELVARDLGLAAGLGKAIPLGVNADSLATWFLAPLAELSTHHGMTFTLHRDDEDYTHRLLETGTVIAAVTTRADAVPGCAVTALGCLTYAPVASQGFGHRHFPKGGAPTEFEKAPIVDFDERDDLQTRWLSEQGIDASGAPRHRIPASSQFAAAIGAGLGWGLLPREQREQLEAATGLPLIHLPGPHVRVPLFLQRWRSSSATLDTICETIVSHARAALESV